MSITACHKNRFTASLVIGFGLILLGGLFALRNLGLLPTHEALRFWPLALLLLALASFAKRGFLSWGGHGLLFLAVILQCHALGLEGWIERWWPVGLIWLGCIKVMRSLFPREQVALPDHEQGSEGRTS